MALDIASASYNVGWIAALPIERAAATAVLDERHEQPRDFLKNASDANQYTWGQIGPHRIVVASLPSGEHGTNAATVTARSMLASLPWIRIGLLVGIGAGVPHLDRDYDIRLGDIVVSQPQGISGGVVQYGLTADGKVRPSGTLNMPPSVIRSGIAKLQAEHEMKPSIIPDLLADLNKRYPHMAKSTRRKPGYVHQGTENDTYSEDGQVLERIPRETCGPEIFYGTIASSNVMIEDSGMLRDAILALSDGPEDMICLESEAAGLMNNFPCIVIRGISSYAGLGENNLWQRYASATAACFTKELLGVIDVQELDQTATISELRALLVEVRTDVHELRETGKATHLVVTEMRSEDHRRELRQWLKPADPSVNFQHAMSQRQAGTGSWLLSTYTYQAWRARDLPSDEPTIIWLHGQSGCGKSLLATAVIEDLKQAAIPHLYFYFDFRDSSKQSLNAVLKSLLWQSSRLSDQAFNLVDAVRKSSGGQQPSSETLLATFESVLLSLECVHIVLDALDEADPGHEVLRWVQHCISAPTFIARAQLLFTSRPENDITSALRLEPVSDISADASRVDDDIRTYLRGRLLSDPRLARWSARVETRNLIERTLSDKAGGMFRWVACQLDSLSDCLSLRDLKNALDALPPGLDETYARILGRIPSQLRAAIVRLLQLLLIAQEPVSLGEAVNLLAVDLGDETFFDPDNELVDPMDVSAYCPSLIAVVDWDMAPIRSVPMASTWHTFEPEEWRIVQFAHLSVKQYLLSSPHGYWPELSVIPAAISMTKIMLRSVSFWHNEVERMGCRDASRIIDDLASPFPLGVLAAHRWNNFAVPASESLDFAAVLAGEFLDPDLTERNHELHFAISNDDWTSSNLFSLPDKTPLSLAVGARLTNVAKVILARGGHLRRPDEVKRCLELACFQADAEMIALLLLHAQPDTTTLIAACKGGHIEICSRLLDLGVKPDDPPDNAPHDAWHNQLTPLATACRNRSLAIVKVLLEHGADPNHQYTAYGNPLSWAVAHVVHDAIEDGGIALEEDPIQHGIDLVKALLHAGADPNIDIGRHYTVLMMACGGSNLDLVRLLLAHGAEIDAVASDAGGGGSALSRACRYGGSVELVKELLQRGADPNTGGALAQACCRGSPQVAELLLKHGADPNATQEICFLDRGPMVEDIGPIQLVTEAAIKGHQEIVRLLLRHGATPDTTVALDSSEGQPLHLMLGIVSKNATYMEGALHNWEKEMVGRHLIPLLDQAPPWQNPLLSFTLLLTLACSQHDLEWVQCLLAKVGPLNGPQIEAYQAQTGYDVHARMSEWLRKAMGDLDVPLTKILLEAGVNANGINRRFSPLTWFVKDQQYAGVEELARVVVIIDLLERHGGKLWSIEGEEDYGTDKVRNIRKRLRVRLRKRWKKLTGYDPRSEPTLQAGAEKDTA